MRTLIAFSDFLLRDYGDRLEAEGQEFVRYLVDASRRMRAMIHGMLNLSRAGKVIGEFHAVDLDELVAVVKTDLGELIRSKGAEVRVVGPLPSVWGDRDRIGQLLANLISNGLKYNKSPKPVGRDRSDHSRPALARRTSTTTSSPGADVTISVKDNGIGIEPSSTRRSSSSSGGFIPGGVRGHGRGPGHLQQDRPGPRRPDLGRERAWARVRRFSSGSEAVRLDRHDTHSTLADRRVDLLDESAGSQVALDEPNAR